MTRAKTPFLSFIARCGGADLRPDQFPIDMANRFRRVQLRRTIEQMRIMLACNTFFAPALSYQAWNAGINGLVIAWTCGIIAFSWWLFFSWKAMYETDGNPRDMHRFVVETFGNAFFWGVGMALFYPVVGGEEKAIVATVMAGSLALGTVGFSQAPSAAFIYLTVLTSLNTAVALFCGISTGSPTDYLMACLSLAAGVSVFNASLERGKSSIAAFEAHEDVNEKSEVIELLLKDYEEQATQWLWQTDAKGHIVRAPDQILALLGVSTEELSGVCLVDLICAKCTAEAEKDAARLQPAFDQHTEFHDFQFSFEDPDSGELRWILMKGRPQLEADEFRGFRGIFADATVSVVAERKVQFTATYDSLTKLHNRDSAQKHLSELRPDADFAVVFLIDLDGFKQVNDSYGHHVGDGLLQDAADRLRSIGTSDCIIARLGGDEFFVLMKGQKRPTDTQIAHVADRIVDHLSQPFQVEDYNIRLSASVGLTRFPDDAIHGSELLQMADLALYQAKHDGRNRFAVFHIDMQKALSEKMMITERLRLAVKQGQITPYYQSQHALGDGRLIGFEALARWIDDAMGFVGPDVFIPIAEQTGLIVELGEQLLRTACRDATHWVETMGTDAPVLSVNFSPVQFARTDVAALVARVLAETNYPPNLLEIEITEGVLISNKELIAQTLREISALGVSIALDDFGTGYSSLSYLKDLPLHRLKIDRSFVCDLGDVSSSPIVTSIIQLGHSLGLSVIAEGIEDEAQIEMLAQLGCDDGQGYFYSKAMTIADANAQFVDKVESDAAREAG